jgi:hypothetical protein
MKSLPLIAALLMSGTMLLSQDSRVADPYQPIALAYVRLVLAVGQHDADFVDAYYGPADMRKAAEAEKLPLATIADRARVLEAEIGRAKPPAGKADADLWRLRQQYLHRQVGALRARVYRCSNRGTPRRASPR